MCYYSFVFSYSDARKYLFGHTNILEQLMETLIARAAPPTAPPAVTPESEGANAKKAYCYGAKPFIPIVGHCIQLAKSIDQLLTAEAIDSNSNNTSVIRTTSGEVRVI